MAGTLVNLNAPVVREEVSRHPAEHLEDFDRNAEGFRAAHPSTQANLDNALATEGTEFTAAGVYRNFDNLDEIYNVAPGSVVPRGVILIADRDLLPEPARSRVLGRRVPRLEDIGPEQPESQPVEGFREPTPVLPGVADAGDMEGREQAASKARRRRKGISVRNEESEEVDATVEVPRGFASVEDATDTEENA